MAKKEKPRTQVLSFKALVRAAEPRKPKQDAYVFSNGRKFKEKTK